MRNDLSTYIAEVRNSLFCCLNFFAQMHPPNGMNGIGKIVGNIFSMAGSPIVLWPTDGTLGVLL